MSEFKEVLLLVITALIAWRQPVVPGDPLLKFTGHDPSNISWNWKQLVTREYRILDTLVTFVYIV